MIESISTQGWLQPRHRVQKTRQRLCSSTRMFHVQRILRRGNDDGDDDYNHSYVDGDDDYNRSNDDGDDDYNRCNYAMMMARF